MALKNDFYNEIFINEQKWMDMINKNLLNSIYCNLSLKPFYIEKKRELEEEYRLTNNILMGQIIFIINQIINKIDLLNQHYLNSKSVNMNELSPLFLVNQMSNAFQKEDNKINEVMEQKQILKNYNINEMNNQDDYLYDDFPEETKKVI